MRVAEECHTGVANIIVDIKDVSIDIHLDLPRIISCRLIEWHGELLGLYRVEQGSYTKL